MAIRLLTESGVKQSAIVFVTVVVCPEVRIHCLSTHRYFRGIASKNGGGALLFTLLFARVRAGGVGGVSTAAATAGSCGE